MRKILYKHRNKILDTWFGIAIAIVLIVLIVVCRAETTTEPSAILGAICSTGMVTAIPIMMMYSIKKK